VVDEIACLVDIFGYFNELNLGLQDKIMISFGILKNISIRETLQHWRIRVVQ